MFGDLGNLVLENAWSGKPTTLKHLIHWFILNRHTGFNTSLFAYGQTGSGKSYSSTYCSEALKYSCLLMLSIVVGYGVNRGIVPISCEQLFERMDKAKSPDKRFKVGLSMRLARTFSTIS